MIRMRNFIAILAAFLAVASVSICAAQQPNDAWEQVAVPTTASFRSLSVVSEKIVWTGGTEGTVLRTIDGGATWQVHTVRGAEKLDFRGLHAFDANSAVIMSSGNAEDGQARIYRTSDGGESWQLAYEQKTRGVFFDAIAFWDRTHGIVVSDPVDGRFALFSTDDGGTSWSQIPAANLPPALPNEGAFAASNSCLTVEGESNAWFVTGGAGVARVFRSSDRGRTWKVADTAMHPANASTGLFSVAFRDAQNGVAVGGDYAHPSDSPGPVIFLTRDGGITWSAGPATDPPGLFLSSVVYAPVARSAAKANRASEAGAEAKRRGEHANEIVAAGSGGIVAQSARGIVTQSANGKWMRTSSANVNVVAFAPSGTAWAAGPKGTLLRLAPQ